MIAVDMVLSGVRRMAVGKLLYFSLIPISVVTYITLSEKHILNRTSVTPLPQGILTTQYTSESFNEDQPIVIWTNDYHIATIQDVRDLLEPLGVRFIDKSLTPKCKLYNSCADNLTVINFKNALTLNSSLIPKFYEAYKSDWQMQRVNAFLCFHPTAMCELFMPFNKSIIAIASTRFELGRFDPDRWSTWIHNYKTIAKDPKNFVGANNLYDANYIKYFTGLDVPVIQSYCGYAKARYQPTKSSFLLFSGRRPTYFHHRFFRNQFNETCDRLNCTENNLELYHFRTLYPYFEFRDLVSHKGIVFIPYQVSVMTLFELYEMNIPLFIPSLELQVQWQIKYLSVRERTFKTFRFHERSNGSDLPPHPSQFAVPDPNDDTSEASIRYWFKFADFYNLPHITYFDSIDDLVSKLLTANYRAISQRMRNFNKIRREKTLRQWKDILLNVSRYSRK